MKKVDGVILPKILWFFFYAHLIELSKIFDHQQILEFCLMVNLLPISTI